MAIPPPMIWTKDLAHKVIIFTSTNGTMVLKKITGAKAVYTSSFINHSATCEKVKDAEKVQIFVSGRPDGK
ncbi:2-phosphosulfolactate phosphatase, partial [mine drainage metagenome]